MEAIKTFAEEGGKVLAECGGMMFLTRSRYGASGGNGLCYGGRLAIGLYNGGG